MTDPLGGAGGTDPNAQSGGDGNQGTGDGTQAGAQSGAPGTGDGTQGSGQSATFTQAEYDALKARMQAADQRASKAEADAKLIRDKDLPEMQKMTRDLAEATETIKTVTAANADLRIANAFLTDSTQKWRNPGTALKLLDRSKITVDSDGTVTGMKDALSALAKSDPYLLEDTQGGDGGSGGTGQGQQGTPPVGTPPANGGLGGGTKPTADAMKSRFPALRTRLG